MEIPQVGGEVEFLIRPRPVEQHYSTSETPKFGGTKVVER